ncbi:MAG: hypothetical protein A2314_03710 [Elusimicrobia bacterium RIFOXYB2_FULL_50_12]|nr:MAG: hypothetical protein A2314_03710 [Elusimicrobia bacterium RIFOXYB2_FULL_50_12]
MSNFINGYVNVANLLLGVSIHFTHIAGYVLGGIAVLLSWFYFRKLKEEKFLIYLGVFIIYGLIRAVFSTEPAIAYNTVFAYFSHWVIPFILGYIVSSEIAFRRTFWTYYTAFFVLVAFSVLAYFGLFFQKIGPDLYLAREGLLKGLNSHIGLAGLCLMFSFFALGQALYADNLSVPKKRFFVLSVFFFLGALFLTGSRGYYLSAIFVYSLFGITVLLTSGKRAAGLVIFSVIGSACLVMALYFLAPDIKTRINRTNINDTNVQERLCIYSVALREIKAKPVFGFGPGLGIRQKEFFDFLPEHRKNVMTFPHLHSFYLNLAADFGLTGLVIFFVITFAWLKKIHRCFTVGAGINRVVAFGLFWGVIGILAGDMMDTFLRGPRVGMDLFWLTGLLFGSTKIK